MIVPISKGDMHDPGKYRSVTLLSQVLKLLERVGDFGETAMIQEGER